MGVGLGVYVYAHRVSVRLEERGLLCSSIPSFSRYMLYDFLVTSADKPLKMNCFKWIPPSSVQGRSIRRYQDRRFFPTVKPTGLASYRGIHMDLSVYCLSTGSLLYETELMVTTGG